MYLKALCTLSFMNEVGVRGEGVNAFVNAFVPSSNDYTSTNTHRVNLNFKSSTKYSLPNESNIQKTRLLLFQQTPPSQMKHTHKVVDMALHAIVRGSMLNSMDMDDIGTNDMTAFVKSTNGNRTNDILLSTPLSSPTSPQKKSTMVETLLQLSSIASLLCVVDCTILPLVTLLLSFTGPGPGLMGGASSATFLSTWLHELGHSIALFFVLPVGFFAATMNFLAHRKPLISSLAVLGLLLIYISNGQGGMIFSLIPNNISHALNCGDMAHKVCNITGCMLLMGSNYISHKTMKGCAYSYTNNINSKFDVSRTTNIGNRRQVAFCCNMPGCNINKSDSSDKDEKTAFFSW